MARNRAHVESDVDILIVLKEHECSGEPIHLRESELTFRYSWILLSNSSPELAEACGHEISLMCIYRIGREAMSVLKPSFHAVHFTEIVRILNTFVRKQSVNYLDDGGLKRLDVISQAKTKEQVAKMKT